MPSAGRKFGHSNTFPEVYEKEISQEVFLNVHILCLKNGLSLAHMLLLVFHYCALLEPTEILVGGNLSIQTHFVFSTKGK